MFRHENNPICSGCTHVFNRYEGFHIGLRAWFMSIRARYPEAHVSCAGRGRVEQDRLRAQGHSRAVFGKSAHNFNAAIDVFEQSGDYKDIYERPWFEKVIGGNLPTWLEWYGSPNASFPELPHIQIRGWKELVSMGELLLVDERFQKK